MKCIFPKTGCVLYLSLIGFNGYRYTQYQNVANWTTARDVCQTINGGNLTSIDNQAQQDYLFRNFRGYDVSVWIGLNDIKVCKSNFLILIPLLFYSSRPPPPHPPSPISSFHSSNTLYTIGGVSVVVQRFATKAQPSGINQRSFGDVAPK